MAKHAALTIVSKNYLAYARTLADCYKRHHPENDFIVILVDRADGSTPGALPCGAEIVEIANIAIPDITRFIYRYSIMELNTAVKPFVFADLFRRRKYETIVYLDPDIFVFQPLTHVYRDLEAASIVLTPHMRRPFYDDALPNDVAILQSGTYNLGFIGLRNSDTSRQFVNWWMTKLHKDCIVDVPKGLFVDQKWIDLVPGFFPDHKILYEPGYNAAYWNLHERPLSRRDGEWLVGGEPLYFFHFSGYNPFAPLALSKHQNRHQLSGMPTLKRLTDFYGRALLENDYDKSSGLSYAFETLTNGVRIPLQLVTAVMQWAVRNRISTPCPVNEPEAFCRFLMSRGVIPNNPNAVLLFDFLLRARSDVLAAFPNAQHDSDDRGFRDWVSTSGIREYQFDELLKFENKGAVLDRVADIFQRVRGIEGVEDKYRVMWSDQSSFDDFVNWITSHGVRQLGIARAHLDILKKTIPAIGRILNVYFLRGDLQVRFPILSADSQISEFVTWLNDWRHELRLTQEEISLFAEFARSSKQMIEAMRFVYLHKGAKNKASPNIYWVDQRRREIGCTLTTTQTLDFLYESKVIDPLDHYLEAFEGDEPSVLNDYGRFSVDGLDHRRNFLFLQRLEERLKTRRATPCVTNLAAYLTAPSGMGESGRSMRRTLEHCGVTLRVVTLPHVRAEYDAIPTSPYLFGWPASGASVSVTVANADCADILRVFLPRSYWAEKNIGYWVWETEELPITFKKSEELFDEIWTPSAYSAKAISRTADRSVRVVPHVLDFEALRKATANRRRFRLPEKATLFGFMFDPDSGIERKNVAGLIEAFCAAFRKDDGCYLVLKANGATEGVFSYEMLKARTSCDYVLFYEEVLTRSDSYNFLASLDVYASLHRSEGFGLTCAEAMAIGTPVVASGYSGNVDFMNEENSLLVKTRVIETDRQYGPYPAGTRWGEPDAEQAISALRSLRDRSKRLDLGRRGKESVQAQLNAEAVGSQVAAMIAAITGAMDFRLPEGSRDGNSREEGSYADSPRVSTPVVSRP